MITMNPDRISLLPDDIVTIIFRHLPLRDIIRTCILSKNWRFQWVRFPRLIFDRETFGSTNMNVIDIVTRVIQLHQGPIVKFELDLSRRCVPAPGRLRSVPLLDMERRFSFSRSHLHRLISVLSKKEIRDLTIVAMNVEILPFQYQLELPSSIFSCAGLKHFRLDACVFQYSTFVGYDRFIMEFNNIGLNRHVHITCGPLLGTLKLKTGKSLICFSVDGPDLRSLCTDGFIFSIGLVNAPRLNHLCLKGIPLGPFHLTKLLHSLPRLEYLELDTEFHKLLVVPDSQNELPSLLNFLRRLELPGFELNDMKHISSTVLWIRSQPNLQKVSFTQKLFPVHLHWRKVELYFQMLRYADYSLMKLREVEFEIVGDAKPCIAFIKFLLAISPKLEALYIVSLVSRIHSLYLELQCLPRASPKAEIVFFGWE